jgi:hypothetical protein
MFDNVRTEGAISGLEQVTALREATILRVFGMVPRQRHGKNVERASEETRRVARVLRANKRPDSTGLLFEHRPSDHENNFVIMQWI